MSDKLTRRDFIKGAFALGTTAAGLALGGRAFVDFMQSLHPPDRSNEQEGNPQVWFPTVAEFVSQFPDLESTALLPAAQAVFGPEARFSAGDQIAVIPAPQIGQSISIEMAGFTNEFATTKKGSGVVFTLEIQRKEDTDPAWIFQPQGQSDSEFVIKENSANSPFQNLTPAYGTGNPGEQGITKGFGMVQSQRGLDPILICFGVTDEYLMFVSPAESFWIVNGQEGLNLSQQMSVKFGPLAHPLSDEPK